MQRPANYLTEIETYLEKALAEALEVPLRLIKIGTLIFSPEFATVGRSKERAFEQKEKVHKHFPLPR